MIKICLKDGHKCRAFNGHGDITIRVKNSRVRRKTPKQTKKQTNCPFVWIIYKFSRTAIINDINVFICYISFIQIAICPKHRESQCLDEIVFFDNMQTKNMENMESFVMECL